MTLIPLILTNRPARSSITSSTVQLRILGFLDAAVRIFQIQLHSLPPSVSSIVALQPEHRKNTVRTAF